MSHLPFVSSNVENRLQPDSLEKSVSPNAEKKVDLILLFLTR